MKELLNPHREIYDVRWRGKDGDLKQLKNKMYNLAREEGIDMEFINELETQLEFPPYVHYLPEHLKSMHGGKRGGSGRPSVGTTKKVSLTLSDEIWKEIQEMKEEEGSTQSAILREIVGEFFETYNEIVTPGEKQQYYDEFETFIFHSDLSKLHFNINKLGLLMDTIVTSVEHYKNGIRIEFGQGYLSIFPEDKILKCKSLGLLNLECGVCYSIYNVANEHIGFIYLKE